MMLAFTKLNKSLGYHKKLCGRSFERGGGMLHLLLTDNLCAYSRVEICSNCSNARTAQTC